METIVKFDSIMCSAVISKKPKHSNDYLRFKWMTIQRFFIRTDCWCALHLCRKILIQRRQIIRWNWCIFKRCVSFKLRIQFKHCANNKCIWFGTFGYIVEFTWWYVLFGIVIRFEIRLNLIPNSRKLNEEKFIIDSFSLLNII